MSLVRWLITLDPVRVQCSNCGTRLTPTRRWRRRYYSISAFAMLIIISPSILAYFHIIPFDNVTQIFLVVVALTLLSLIFLSALFWKRFEYQQYPSSSQQAEKL